MCLIERNTAYVNILRGVINPNFNWIRSLAMDSLRNMSEDYKNYLYGSLNHGINILTAEQQMWIYLFSYGLMHQKKLNVAFENIPNTFFNYSTIRIIDYGCGQAIGTMCYADYLRNHNYAQEVKNVTLIEPSEICLKRAALHISKFFPDTEINTIRKKFDELSSDDICCDTNIPTLHIMSNVLDLLDFNLIRFATLIKKNLKGYNQFVCVSPYFSNESKDCRIGQFFSYVGEKNYYNRIFRSNELVADKTWTAQIRCFSTTIESLKLEVTEEDIANGIEDEYGVVYSRSGKMLLKCQNNKLEQYSIRRGTIVICIAAFWECSCLQQITIPDTIRYIGVQAFWNCKALQQISIPNSVLGLGACTFNGCTSLKRIIIPQSVTQIYGGVFSNSPSLQQVSIVNNSIFDIKNKMLIDINSRKIISHFGSDNSVIIPDSITVIENYAFYNSTIEHITIPDSVVNIGDSAFGGCFSLKHIVIRNNAIEDFKKKLHKDLWDKLEEKWTTGISENDLKNGQEDEYGVMYSCSGKRLLKCKNKKLKNYSIKEGTKVICNNAFENCRSLQYIYIPNSVIAIGSSCFVKCELLQKINISDSISCIEDHTLSSCRSLQQISLPDSITKIGNSAFSDCSSLQTIVIPSTVTSIGSGAFKDCTSLQGITIPQSVMSIGGNPFVNCHVLSSKSSRFIFINKMLIDDLEQKIIAYIGNSDSITIPSSVKTIEFMAFAHNRRLQQITIPNSVTNIGEFACDTCIALTTVSILNPVIKIANNAFVKCDSLKKIIIPRRTKKYFKNMLPKYLWKKLTYKSLFSILWQKMKTWFE